MRYIIKNNFYIIVFTIILLMQFQSQTHSPSAQRKQHLFTINSLNHTTRQNKSLNKNNQTLDHGQRQSMQYCSNIPLIHNQLVSTKIINVQLNNSIITSFCKKDRNNKSNNKIFYSSDKYKNKTNQKNHEIYRKGKGGVKVIAKYKYPLNDQKTPMKRYIKIQKIQLPNFDLLNKNSAIKMNANSSNQQMTQNMKKTIEQYSRYIQRKRQNDIKSSITKSKIHRRNHSSIIDHSKNLQLTTEDSQVEKNNRKFTYIQDFQIRRPLGRKDYFVFGMTDRNTPQNKVQCYRDFLWKVNFANCLHVQTPDLVINPYKAYIGPGNNYHLVKSVLKRRFWWNVVQKVQPNQSYQTFNFLWTQLKQNSFFQIQNKSNYSIYFEQKLQMPSLLKKSDSLVIQDSICPLTQQDFHKKLFSRTDLINWNKHVLKNEKSQQKINQHTYLKRMSLYQNKLIINIQNSVKLKVHNHLESNFFIGNKKALFYNVRRYLSLKKIDPFSILPLTFHISKGVQDQQFKTFKKYFQQIQQNKNTSGLRNLWIVKPGQNTNRGNGITVAYSLDDIVVRLKGRQRNSDGKLRTFIIQKYIQKPLLYCKRKFDIRHYMLITCTNGVFRGFWYQEGYIRTSSMQFTTKYSKDPFVHLTNDAIQKNGANYGKYEKGNKLSYQDFQKYIQLNYKNKKINFFENILPQMRDIAAQSIKATYSILDQKRRQHNFQLLGLDFMIDQDFKPWLIQVNTNPCLQLSCSLLQRIIPNLIDNVFRLCIDPLFPPPETWQTGKKLYFGQSPLTENKFQLIFDEIDDGKQIQKLYQGENKFDQKMGKIQQDDEIFQDDGDEDWENKK